MFTIIITSKDSFTKFTCNAYIHTKGTSTQTKICPFCTFDYKIQNPSLKSPKHGSPKYLSSQNAMS